MAVAPVGKHYILELFDCPAERINDHQLMRRAIEQASHHSHATLLQIVSHTFEPQGVTVLGLLAESHISAHAWPEFGYVAVDVFTCGDTTQPDRACQYLIQHLGAARHDLRVMPRGGPVADAPPASPCHPATPQERALCQARN